MRSKRGLVHSGLGQEQINLYLSQTGMDMSPNYRRAVKYSRRLLPREPNMHCFRLPSR